MVRMLRAKDIDVRMLDEVVIHSVWYTVNFMTKVNTEDLALPKNSGKNRKNHFYAETFNPFCAVNGISCQRKPLGDIFSKLRNGQDVES